MLMSVGLVDAALVDAALVDGPVDAAFDVGLVVVSSEQHLVDICLDRME